MIGKPKRDEVKALIGPSGTTANEMYPKLGCAWQTASNILCDMARIGEIYRVKYSHKSVRFFATEADAIRHQPKTTRAPVIVQGAARPAYSKDAQIIVPKGVKRTYAKTPLARFAVTGPVIGGFATAGIGRYLETV